MPNASTGRNVTIPHATDIFSRNKWMKIVNVSSSFPLTIVTNANFLGKYGSGTTTLTIPINTWVELLNNGSNWLVNDRSPNFNNTELTPVSTTTILTDRLDFTNAFSI